MVRGNISRVFWGKREDRSDNGEGRDFAQSVRSFHDVKQILHSEAKKSCQPRHKENVYKFQRGRHGAVSRQAWVVCYDDAAI